MSGETEVTVAPAADAPVEVELTAEEIAGARQNPTPPLGVEPEVKAEVVPEPAVEPAAEEKPDTKPRRRAPAHERIRELHGRATAAEAERDAERAERVRLATKQAETDAANLYWFEKAITGEHKDAERELATAIEKGDATAQAKAQSALADSAAKVANLNAWKAANPTPARQEPASPPPPPPAPERPREVAPEVSTWVGDNPWFDASADNDEFDQEMHIEAVRVGALIEGRLKRQGKGAEIGKPAYWAEINKHMRAEFPDYEWSTATSPPPPAPAPKMQGRSPVAAAQPAAAAAPSAPTKITLTGEERAFALSLPHTDARGQPVSDAEKLKRYALGKQTKMLRDAEMAKQK